MAEEKLMKLKPDVIKDVFVMDGMEIAVVNNEYLSEGASLAFGKLVRKGEVFVLEPINDEQYEKASAKYAMLLELFLRR